MEIIRPTEAELQGLLAEHVHRFPEKARFTVVGDGGAEVTLPVLLGNPSGACKIPEGRVVSPAWGETVAATFKMRAGAETDTPALVADCVLWPPAPTWSEWTSRWAALPERVFPAIRRKTGAELDMLEDPKPGEKPPDALAGMLQRTPAAVWRRLKPPGAEFFAAIIPPDPGLWRLFVDGMKKRDEKHAQLARDLATASLLAIVNANGEAVPSETLLDRWPGQALLVDLIVSHLAGLTADYALGEW